MRRRVRRGPRGEGIERAEPFGEFDGSDAALAIEPTQKIRSRLVPFLRIAFQAAGDEVAIGVPSQCGLRHDVVEALHFGGEAAQAVKAPAMLALVDRLAKGLGLQEIDFLKIIRSGQRGGVLGFDLAGAGGENFVGRAHFDNVARLAAFDQAQDALAEEAAQALAGGAHGKPRATGEPANGKVEPKLALEAGVPEEVIIDGTVDNGQAQARNEKVFDLFACKFSVRFLVIHDLDPKRKVDGRSLVTRKRKDKD